MNIDQYRALKAQEASKVSASAPTQPATPQTTPQQTPPVVAETKPKEDGKPVVPEKVAIDGIGEVDLEELKKGYLRQSDYTQKTQDVARQRREVQDAVSFYEQVKTNPELLKDFTDKVKVPDTLDPTTAQVVELKNMVYDMMLEKEVDTLQAKYPDFDLVKVSKIAQEKRLTNLEDAYMIYKGTSTPSKETNQADLEAQIRAKILAELESEKTSTQTIIGTHGSSPVVVDNSPKLNPAEQKVARMMFRTAKDPYAEYAKWRDFDRKK